MGGAVGWLDSFWMKNRTVLKCYTDLPEEYNMDYFLRFGTLNIRIKLMNEAF